ncbi:MAG: ribosome maturation factor RimP [Campylobacter sp.]|nr:ribosome maturation factor RimP [Campylobacter sp.]
MKELEKLVQQCGVELYGDEVVSENGKKIYRVYITKEGGVSLDECEAVSRLLSPIFDVTPPVDGEYFLELSSPGLERKLENPRHFKLSLGELVSVKTLTQLFKGRLVKADEIGIAIENDEGIFMINFDEIKKAKTYMEW